MKHTVYIENIVVGGYLPTTSRMWIMYGYAARYIRNILKSEDIISLPARTTTRTLHTAYIRRWVVRSLGV